MKTLGYAAAVVLIGLSLLAGNAGAQTEIVLHYIGISANDGAFPFSGLVQSSDGSFYGTDFGGGAFGGGAVFRVTSNGSYSNLYSFSTFPQRDGQQPRAALIQGNDGNFYGTTSLGGMHFDGIVFRVSPSGSETNIYSFYGFPDDGANPSGGLVQGSDGNFYGTTPNGGISTNCSPGCGTVFRISPGGSETNLHSFLGSPSEGNNPYGSLVQGSDGNFYGTTIYGGMSGAGTVFWINSGGSYTTLYSFVGSPGDGANPYAGLVQGSDGDFYGTTEYGGASNTGTVFRISSSGVYTTLYSFVGSPNDGGAPASTLLQGSDGNFYGSTLGGGTNNAGTIFRINPGGSYTNLYSFAGPPNDGSLPFGSLVQGIDGNFYGTTVYGGTNGDGTVFKLTIPLNPPANQINGVQAIGSDMAVSVPSVAGETYQLQFATDLTSGNWSNLPGGSVSNSIGALMTLTNFGGALLPQGFYRFDITP